MQKELSQKIADLYGLGSMKSFKELEGGVLNKNYSFETSKGKYFVKHIREVKKNYLPIIQKVESVMKENGIPAIVMLPSRDGNFWIDIEGGRYSAYKYIESTKEPDNEALLFNAGEMLGKIHKIGKNLSIVDLHHKIFTEETKQVKTEDILRFKNLIQNKNVLNGIDDLFLKYIELKLSIIRTLKVPELIPNTICHGDFHLGNLMFNAESEIKGICDWEQTAAMHRSYAVARSLFYCARGLDNENSDQVENIKIFLRGYRKVENLTDDEILIGMNCRIAGLVMTSWIEKAYYERDDSRANKYIQNEMEIIKYFSNEEEIKRILSEI